MVTRATGYLVSIPIFADSAFVILYPIAKALSKKAAGLFLQRPWHWPRTNSYAYHGPLLLPGPLGVAGIFGVDIGAMMLLGLALGIPCTLAFVLYAQWLAKKYPAFVSSVADDDDITVASLSEKKLPSLTVSLLPIVVPILLILIKALINLFALPKK
jgi:H+/gluconate symporter-like permease